MKKVMTKLLFAVLIISSSCSYDDIIDEDELIGAWKLDQISFNGNDNYNDNIYLMGSTYSFFIDHTLDLIVTQSDSKLTGTWHLKDKSVLVIAFSGVLNEYTIKKINSSDLWLSLKNEDGEVVLKYINSK